MPPLFGLAPGGVYHAAAVTGSAVRSYRTLSTWPHRDAVDCFLWHFPWGRPRRPLTGTVFPWSPDFPRPACASRGRPTLWPGLYTRCALPVQEELEKDGAALPVDDPVDQFGAEAALECDDRRLRLVHVIAPALQREQEAAVGPVRVDQAAGRPGDRQAMPCQPRPIEQFARILLACRRDVGMADDIGRFDAVTRDDIAEQG